MIHITLNNGHSADVPLTKFPKEIFQLLDPMVLQKGGFKPICKPWRTVIALEPGCAYFDIRRNRNDLAVLNAVAWTEEGAVEIWAMLKNRYSEVEGEMAKYGPTHEFMGAVPNMPTTLPWLATWILPNAPMVVNPKDMIWMADFEECLAATIVNQFMATP